MANSAQVSVKRTKKPFSQKMEELDQRWKYEYDMLKDPRTGKIPDKIHEKEIEFAKKQPVKPEGDLTNTYSSLGPTNLGGRTRAFAFDLDDPAIMLSGGVSSGIFRSTNSGANWVNVTPSGEIHNVTAIAQDTRVGFRDTWYYATGESLGNSASLGSAAFYFGTGMYKSTDNGLTWIKLAAFNPGELEGFDSRNDFVHRVVVNPATGDVYAAVLNRIVRSTDGGTTWPSAIILGHSGSFSTGQMTDIVCTSTGRLYAAFSGTAGSSGVSGSPASTPLDGVWTSTSGASGTWTKIAGTGSATSPAGWNTAGAYGRVVLAIAPSDEDIVYALYYTSTSSCAGTPAPEADFFKWDFAGSSWVDRSAFLPNESGCLDGNDPFAVQTGYDLVVSVKPDDLDFVVIGGTNIYRSTDGFATTGATTRIGGYASAGSYILYSGHHPDIHTLVFHPTTSTIMVSGGDGGIHRTSDITASTVAWTNLNNDYITYQYYHIALSPVTGTMTAIGGSQDNGTTYTTGSGIQSGIFGGDGVSVGISAGNTYHYVGFQLGGIYRRFSTEPSGAGTDIKPTGAGSGIFVTKFYLDPDNTEILYYASSTSLYRTTSASTVTPGSWTFMAGVSSVTVGSIFSMATSRDVYSPVSKLYIGTSGGKVYRLDLPATTSPATVPVDITTGLPGIGTVSSIAVDPTDPKKIMVTYSNYGEPGIWYTADASVTTPVWVGVEGSLEMPSIRSCVIVNRLSLPTEYYVGTSVGLFGTDMLAGASTVWTLESPGSIKYSVVSGLALRPADNGLLVGTHGNGMFFSYIADPLPVEISSFTVNVTNRDVILNWTTSNEINNAGFEIERKFTGDMWKKIGFITGNGTTNQPVNYNYTDKGLLTGKYGYRLKQTDYNGNFEYHNLNHDVLIGIPEVFEMSQNYPNPSNPASKINYSIPVTGKVSLKIYDITGKEVAVLVNQLKEAGFHTAEFDGSNLASGVYFYILRSSDFSQTRKLVLVK